MIFNSNDIEKCDMLQVFNIKDIRRYIISFQSGIKIVDFTDMERACQKGFLSILKYHHKNNTGHCWKYAICWAASNGHLEVVKWLNKNRKEGYTIHALIYATRYNHSEVVNWLLEDREKRHLKEIEKYRVKRLEVVKRDCCIIL